MSRALESSDSPVGYVTPKFPSLYWPVGTNGASTPHLYEIKDIWKFNVYWTMLLFAVCYGATGLLASFSHRKRGGGFWILGIFIVLGAIHAVVAGTIVGVIGGTIYKSSVSPMSTWIPLCCAISQMLYTFCTAYSIFGIFI